jgi:hypothetical protein
MVCIVMIPSEMEGLAGMLLIMGGVGIFLRGRD